MLDFEDAKDKVMLGVERRSLVLTEDERRLTAYHEAGHAIVSAQDPRLDPLHKVTIIPRGRALGLTMCAARGRPAQLHQGVARRPAGRWRIGGRVAEELVFGADKVTTGAAQRHRAGHPASRAGW